MSLLAYISVSPPTPWGLSIFAFWYGITGLAGAPPPDTSQAARMPQDRPPRPRHKVVAF